MLFKFILMLMMMVTLQAAPIEERGIKETLRKAAGKYTGKATFFHPEKSGDVGSCGRHESDNNLYVALNVAQYGDASSVSDWCFKKVLIRYGDKSTEATINDACPGCQEKSLDLTPPVFEKLASKDQGVIDISWCVIGEDGCTDGGSTKVSSH